MSFPTCKIKFNSEDEYHTIVKIAAQHDMTLPQYVHASVIRTTNEVLELRAQQAAQLDATAAEEAQAEETSVNEEKIEVTLDVPVEEE